MVEFLKPLHIPRAFLAAVITLIVNWAYFATIDRVLWMFFFIPLLHVLPSFLFYSIGYVYEFLVIVGLLLICSVFYFYRTEVSVVTSAVLGLALVISSYVSESMQNGYETLTDPNGYVHIGHSPFWQSLLIVVATMIFVAIIQYLKPSTFRSAKN